MAHKLAISVDWQGNFDRERMLERVRIADEVGVDSAWIAEAWGRDCFTLLTQPDAVCRGRTSASLGQHLTITSDQHLLRA